MIIYFNNNKTMLIVGTFTMNSLKTESQVRLSIANSKDNFISYVI